MSAPHPPRYPAGGPLFCLDYDTAPALPRAHHMETCWVPGRSKAVPGVTEHAGHWGTSKRCQEYGIHVRHVVANPNSPRAGWHKVCADQGAQYGPCSVYVPMFEECLHMELTHLTTVEQIVDVLYK